MTLSTYKYREEVYNYLIKYNIKFNNKNEILCNQIFIDEGFVNFDKYNLSMVPQFLKSLLLYFNNVVIV